MKKYAKVVDDKGRCDVGIGDISDTMEDENGAPISVREFYESLGMELLDVEEGPDGIWYLADKVPERTYSVRDYDRALEDHIKAVCEARGYTTREPSGYKDSAVPRWAQDAVDFIAFRDACMLYGLEVQNRYAEGLSVPSLEEFKKNLPICTWTYTDEGVAQ